LQDCFKKLKKMKLKFLKFVLPILLVLPSLALAFSEDYTFSGFVETWNLERDIFVPKGLKVNKVCLLSKSLPQRIYLLEDGWNKYGKRWDYGYWDWGDWSGCKDVDIEGESLITFSFASSPISYTATFRIFYQSIGDTRDWLSQNEILGYIGKLADDIPNYIALMMGLPIAFWFVEKTIAFVRGNFRPVEKIKEE
jgi:hypothetical protein